MLSALVVLCAGTTVSASAFYEPADNIKARPYYKSAPHVTEYEYQPHPVYKTQESSYTPLAPTLKPLEHVVLPVHEPLEHAPTPVYKPLEHIPAPVYEQLQDVPAPVYKPVEHVPLPPFTVFKQVEHVPEPVYKLPTYQGAGDVAAPELYTPEPADAQPTYPTLSHHQQASSFQNVAYKVTHQAYRQAELKPQSSAPYR